MGYEDRQYFRDDSTYGKTGLAQFSIVAILIAINFIVWIVDTFTPTIVSVGNSRLPTSVGITAALKVSPIGGKMVIATYAIKMIINKPR